MTRVTHKRSPVQPQRTSVVPFAVAVLALAAVAWTLHDAWVDPLDGPASTGAESEPPAGDANPASGPSQSSPPAPPPMPNSGREGARANLASLFTADDYPADALAREEQGTVRVELGIDDQGRVDSCSVVQSSGSRSLDKATCAIIQQRARFQPARDADRRAVRSTYSQRITWRLEG